MGVFHGVFFDLGSTLLYFDGAWEEVYARSDQAVAAALTEAGYSLAADFPTLFRQRLRAYHAGRDQDMIELTTEKILKDLLSELGLPAPSEEVVSTAMMGMYSVSQEHWKVEADTLEMLKQLKHAGYKLGVISNAANHQDVCTLIDNAEFRHELDFVLTSAKNGMRKPSPKIFKQALAYWDVPPSQVMMVGDLLRPDVFGAQQLGIYSVWITRRADNPENAHYAGEITPDATIAALSELPDLIRRIESEGT